MSSTGLILGVRRETRRQSSCHGESTIQSLVHFWRKGVRRDIYCPLFKTRPEQRNICKVLENNHKGCWEFFIFELPIAFSLVPFPIRHVSGAAHVASERHCSEIVLSECKVLFEWSFMPSSDGSQNNVDIKSLEKLSNLPKVTQLIRAGLWTQLWLTLNHLDLEPPGGFWESSS